MSKTVLITGGSVGIGAATAIRFAQMGYNVAITYNKSANAANSLKEAMALNNTPFLAVRCDVSDPIQVDSAVERTVKTFGGLDVMVNNAGIALQKLISDTTNDDWQSILSTNLSGVFYGCRAAARVMVPKHRGSIVNISSIWGISGASMEVAYSATKSGVIGLTKALAKELGPSGIRVNCLAPGVIDTEMNKNLTPDDFAALENDTPLGRIGKPEEVARLVYFLANDAEFVTGQILSADGGFI